MNIFLAMQKIHCKYEDEWRDEWGCEEGGEWVREGALSQFMPPALLRKWSLGVVELPHARMHLSRVAS